MAVAFRAAGTLGISAAGTPTINYPAGVASGDFLFIQYATAVSGVTPTTPSGWTKLFGPVSMSGGGNNNQGYAYYKIAGGSEPSSITFANPGASNYAMGVMTAYTGTDTTTPVDVSATATNATSGTSGTTPSVTTTKANAMLLRMYWDWTGSTTITPAGTDTERYDTFDSHINIVFELATSTQVTAGASGTTTATFGSATSGGLTATVAIAPPGGAAPVADFTGTPLTGARPLSVAFTDASSNTPTSWSWTFGDGGTSTSQNPTHSYTAAGTYTVALTATNGTGSNTKTRTGYVTVGNPSGTFTKIEWGDSLTVLDEGSGVIRVHVDSSGVFY